MTTTMIATTIPTIAPVDKPLLPFPPFAGPFPDTAFEGCPELPEPPPLPSPGAVASGVTMDAFSTTTHAPFEDEGHTLGVARRATCTAEAVWVVTTWARTCSTV